MKYLLIISLLFSTAYGQTVTSTQTLYVFDSTHLKDTGILGFRDAVVFLYKKFNQFTANPGVVTQLTSKATTVTLNKMAGQITMAASALAGNAKISFTLNNSFITMTDVVIPNVKSPAALYTANVTGLANGSCAITITNLSASSGSHAIVLNFLIIK